MTTKTDTKSATSRRTLLATGAALAAAPVAAAVPIVTSTVPDPIFAAIDAHKAAFLRGLPIAMEHATTPIHTAKYDELGEAQAEADDIALDAAMDLADIAPTTIAGVLALIDYVRDFNQGKFGIGGGWHSGLSSWPNASQFEFEVVDDYDEECGMAYAVLLNVRAALANLAGAVDA
jgi:hypothetical protein